MFNDEEYVPWSGRRYKVNIHGKIFDFSGNEIKSFKENDEVFVELEWVLGKRKYLLSLVMLYSFGKIKLPDYLLDFVEPLYLDDNKSNLHIVNLIYRFKDGPIEVIEYPGFYYIPFFCDYAISKNGQLINIKTGKYKEWSITKTGGIKNQTGGYYYSRCITEDGISKVLFLHRALCLVFKKYDNKVLSIVVNHLDGKPSNNTLDNLEWCTYSENNLHAVKIGLRPNSSLPVLMKNLYTGEITRFESVTACCRHLKHNGNSFIYYRLRDKTNKVFSDMLMFKYDDESPWPVIDINKVKIHRTNNDNDIIARNVFTGNLIIFNGCRQGEELTGVNQGTILRHLRDNALIPCKGYNFKFLDDKTEWIKHTDRHLKIYEKYPIYPPDGIILTNIETNDETFYCSAAEAANALNLSKTLLANIVNKNLKWNNKFSLKYFKLRECLSPVTA